MATIDDLRLAVSDLHALAAGDLRSLWASVTNADEAREALEDLLPAIIRTYGTASATVAADWYDELREELDVDRRFLAIVSDAKLSGISDMVGWSVSPLYSAEPDWLATQTRIESDLQLRIANASRDTVTGSAIEDPGSTGWQRSASGGCGFCQMLAGRGGVYKRSTVDFGAHANCQCVAVPAFKDREVPVKAYAPSLNAATPAERARTRDWMREHGYL